MLWLGRKSHIPQGETPTECEALCEAGKAKPKKHACGVRVEMLIHQMSEGGVVSPPVMNPPATNVDWSKSPSAPEAWLMDNESMFRQLFERSADAMLLSDPATELFVDCNQAAVEMMRASSKEQLLMKNPADLSPEFQADGRSSRERVHEDTAIVMSEGTHRFEWRARRMDGTEFPVDVLLTRIETGERTLVAAVCRDITARKRAERELRELTHALERRVSERTAALTASEARFRALVEHA